MDKVTQQNAANAEESASASEELSAQAESMNQAVQDLVALVGGSTTAQGQGCPTTDTRFKDASLHNTPSALHQPAQSVAEPKGKPVKVLARNEIPLQEEETTHSFSCKID